MSEKTLHYLVLLGAVILVGYTLFLLFTSNSTNASNSNISQQPNSTTSTTDDPNSVSGTNGSTGIGYALEPTDTQLGIPSSTPESELITTEGILSPLAALGSL
jgi:hypothetical protein